MTTASKSSPRSSDYAPRRHSRSTNSHSRHNRQANQSTPDLISVIVPVYNSVSYLPRLFDSLRCQTYPHFELLLIDDGSTDESLALCRRFAATDSRVRVLAGSNHGVSHARNRGLQAARGAYLTFVDNDDQITPDCLTELHAAAETHRSDLVIGNYRKLIGNQVETPPLSSDPSLSAADFLDRVLDPSTGFGCIYAKLIRTAFAKSLRFDESLVVAEDSAFFIDLAGLHPRISVIPAPLYDYCVNQTSTVRRFDPNYADKYYHSMTVISQKLPDRDLSNYIFAHLAMICVNFCCHPDRSTNQNTADQSAATLIRTVAERPLFKAAVKHARYTHLSPAHRAALFALKHHLYGAMAAIGHTRQHQLHTTHQLRASALANTAPTPATSPDPTSPRILIYGISDQSGGTEAVIMNYLRHFSPNLRCDFLCNTKHPVFRAELEARGSRLYCITPRSVNPKQNRAELDAFFKHHAKDYSAIWVNLNSLTNIDYLKLARKYGIKRRIVHAHNSNDPSSKLRLALHYLHRPLITRYATDFWACSRSAAHFFYPAGLPITSPSDSISTKHVALVRNAIDLTRFQFNATARRTTRRALGLKSSDIVLGNTGRLTYQKNQIFLLKLLAKLPASYKLFLVGTGDLEIDLRRATRELKLTDRVTFLGSRNDIPNLLNAFDIFVFSSHYEGFGISTLEALTSGLPIIIPDDIVAEIIQSVDSHSPAALHMLPSFSTLDETSALDLWAKTITTLETPANTARTAASHANLALFKRSGLNISDAAHQVEDLFND